MQAESGLCLCFPCILYYMGGYITPHSEDQVYPVLQNKGFSPEDQKAIAEEWYWIALERETDVADYLRGYVSFTDGCYWRRPPPLPRPRPRESRTSNARRPPQSAASTPASSVMWTPAPPAAPCAPATPASSTASIPGDPRAQDRQDNTQPVVKEET